MRITWIGGWGVAPESLRPIANTYFPGSEHTMLAPTADAVERISNPLTPADGVRGAPDVTIAWSLGAWRLLEAASKGARFGGMVMLTQSVVKTALAWSTVAQMGFMLLQCGLGLWPLALLHISLAVRAFASTRLGAWGNAAAIALFIVTALFLVLRLDINQGKPAVRR